METYSLTEEKCRVRRELKETAVGLSERYVAEASRAVCERVLQSREFQEAAVVFGYLSFHKEISVNAVLEAALRLGKMVAVPWIISRTEMKAARLVSLENLPLDRYGIRTAPEPVELISPEALELISPEALELILVPGAGFSEMGGRMGRGAGFYDRFLEETKGFRLGVTCDKLLRKNIPTETHDQTMDALVTETKWIRCAGA